MQIVTPFLLMFLLVTPSFLAGEVTPCNDISYPTNATHFRGSGFGSHENERLAKRMARLDARANLASNISVSIESILKTYFADIEGDDNHDLLHIIEEITVNKVDGQLSHVNVLCFEHDYVEGVHSYFIIVEMKKLDALEDINITAGATDSDLEQRKEIMDFIKKQINQD